MGYIISLILIILCIRYKNSKIMFFLTFFWMWILISFSYGNADYEMYKGLYVQYGQGQIHIGFEFLFELSCKIFYNMGFSYNVFLGVYSFIGLALIGSTIYKFSRNKSIVAICYFLFPFVLDAIQIRNFMAMAIMIFAFRYLLDNSLKSTFKYIILNIISASFHSYTVICFMFIFLKKISTKKIFIITIILTIVVTILSMTNLIIPILSLIMPESKLTAYFVWKVYTPGISSIFKSMILIILTIYIIKLYKRILKNNEQNENNYITLKLLEITEKLHIFFIIFFPMLTYNNQIMRLPRALLIMIYILGGNLLIKRENYIRKDNFILKVLIVLLILIWLQTFIISINISDITIKPILEQNYLLDFFKLEG
ncbi:MAG: EpsG family protein [Clostridia bacterium]|jgi:hypothetical protein|nr:EpsG family protein [Clostridia bacterium]